VDPATLIGIALGIVSLLALMIMEGSSPLAIILLPPLILVFGGTFGAAIAGSAMADVKKIGVNSSGQRNSAASLSAGVSKPRVLRGREFSLAAIASRSS
jgi:hypothetical protein